MFFTWYLTVVTVCLIAAIVTVRLPPLTWIVPEYLDPKAGSRFIPATPDQSLLGRALAAGMDRAATADTPKAIIKMAWIKAVGLVANVLGPSMLIGTLTILVIHNTDVFLIVSYPFSLILGWLNVPEAAAAAPGFVVGFLDMFMPAAVASGIESEFTRFILAGVAVSQIIYMSDLGVIILRSKLPVRFSHLLGIFLLRTFLLIPLFYLAALWVL
jgi:nucleoside recognition membrane protein YjiH